MRPRAADAAWLAALLVVTGLLFAYTVEVRRRWRRDALTPGHHQFLTASTVKFARNWYREGAWSLAWGLLEQPAGVERERPAARLPYPSYPPGAVVPVHLLALARGAEPTPTLVHGWNLANHLALALLAGLLAWTCVRRAGFGPRAAGSWALAPPTAVLLLPQPMYLLQQVYFADQAVLVPFVALVLAELWREGCPPGRRRGATILVALLGVWGLATDWLFAFVLFALYLKRLAAGEAGRDRRGMVRSALRFWAPPAAVLGLFVLQLAVLGVLPELWGKFLYRTGVAPAADPAFPFWETFWLGHLGIDYGLGAVALLWLGTAALAVLLALVLWRRRRGGTPSLALRVLLWPACLLLLPCLLHLAVFRQHARIHDFSALKFLPALAVVLPVLLPAMALLAWRRRERRRPSALRRSIIGLVPVAVLALVARHVVRLHPDHADRFRMIDWTAHDLGVLLDRHAGPRDLVVTPDPAVAIPASGPRSLPLGHTMRVVRHLPDPAALAAVRARLPRPHGILVLLGDAPPPPAWLPLLAAAGRLGACRTFTWGYRLYRLEGGGEAERRSPSR